MTEAIRAVGRTDARHVILVLIFIVTTFNYVDRATLSIAAPAMRKELGFDAVAMGLAFFAEGIGNLGWYIVGDVSPEEIMGISGGIFNQCGNLASIVTPIVIGWIVKEMGSFDLALVHVGALALVGAISYLVVVGPLKRLELGETAKG